MNAGVNSQFDQAKYSRLCERIRPILPRTDSENERLLAEVDRLMSKPEAQLSPEEGAMLELLATVIEKYEDDRYGFQTEIAPHERLRGLMAVNKLRQRDLLDIFANRPTISSVLAGKRAITREQASKLGKRFSMDPAAFIDWPSRD
jgi:HTH-type transcriptional regulator/antitoxin HigA